MNADEANQANPDEDPFQALIDRFWSGYNNTPFGLSVQTKMEMAALAMENNGDPLPISAAQAIDEEMFGNCGRCWWTAYSLAPVGTRFNLGDGFIVEIVAAYGLTCDIVLIDQ